MSGCIGAGGPVDCTTAPGIAGTDEFIQAHREMVNDMAQNASEPAASEKTDTRVALREFQKQKPLVFCGEPEPRVAEYWLRQVEKIMNAMCITEDQTRVSLAASQLEGAADQWWRLIDTSQESRNLTWQQFRDLFVDKYFTPMFRHMMEHEFLQLVQNNTTVTQYEAEFAELARYAHELVPDEETRVRRFLRGLKNTINGRVSVLDLPSYSEAVGRALIAEREVEDAKTLRRELALQQRDTQSRGGSGKRQRTSSATEYQRSHPDTLAPDRIICYQCKQPGHYKRECPQREAGNDFSGSYQSQQSHTDTSAPDQNICFRCKQPGHYRNECPQREARNEFSGACWSQQSRPDTFAPDLSVCFRCEQPGHYRNECPQREARNEFSGSYLSQQSAPTQQEKSSASESLSYEGCRQFQQGSHQLSKRLHQGTFSQGQRTCRRCGQPGHYKHECQRRGAKHNISTSQKSAPLHEE